MNLSKTLESKFSNKAWGGAERAQSARSEKQMRVRGSISKWEEDKEKC